MAPPGPPGHGATADSLPSLISLQESFINFCLNMESDFHGPIFVKRGPFGRLFNGPIGYGPVDRWASPPLPDTLRSVPHDSTC